MGSVVLVKIIKTTTIFFLDQVVALTTLHSNLNLLLYPDRIGSQNFLDVKMISRCSFPMVLPDYPTNKFDRCDVNQAAFSQGPWHADAPHDDHHVDHQIVDTMPDPNQQFSPHAFDWDVTDRLVSQTALAAPPAASALVAASSSRKAILASRPDSPKSGTQRRRSIAATKRSSGSRKTLAPLPDDFEPSNYSVMCGQGNEYFHAIGRFQTAVFVLL